MLVYNVAIAGIPERLIQGNLNKGNTGVQSSSLELEEN